MKHLGDITKISGYTAPIVDCVVGGSPCQDLSIAGKRAGLDGERSGLFMEQVRIVKEMRDRDVRENGRTGVDVRPRYLVWENVPGAFSSNKGEDFRIVLEEIARVKDKDAVIPRPDKWQTSGCIVGDGWSIAWRVLDAQFWGVPQRRRRIALVADFGGESASEILFVRKGVCGHSQPSESERKAVAHDADRSTGTDDIYCIDGDKLNKKERSGGSGIGYREGNQYTLTAKDVHGVAYTMKIRSGCDVNATLQMGAFRSLNCNNVVRTRYTVRRLTPLECERLQGYPDGWTDIGEYTDSKGKKKQSSDAARYKALGNSIALPPWKWVMKRLCACYERDATLASLFSGIGGFDLIWTQLNGYGSVLWESEIENFPSAVCKRHFGDEATGERGDFYEAILGRDTEANVGKC